MRIKNIPKYVAAAFSRDGSDGMNLELFAWVGRRLFPSYKLTWPQLDWFDSAALNAILGRFDEAAGFNAHRRFALQQLLRLADAVPGDTAECGVYKGLGSYIILRHSAGSKQRRQHHCFDSFAGLSPPGERDGEHWNSGALSIPEDVVRRNLAEFGSVVFHKGWIPDRFIDVANQTFSFVHVDVDLYQPTYDSIQFFYDRLNPGALFVCDDYGFGTCPGATAAIDEYLSTRAEKMIGLAGGGGFFIKGCMTSAE